MQRELCRGEEKTLWGNRVPRFPPKILPKVNFLPPQFFCITATQVSLWMFQWCLQKSGVFIRKLALFPGLYKLIPSQRLFSTHFKPSIRSRVFDEFAHFHPEPRPFDPVFFNHFLICRFYSDLIGSASEGQSPILMGNFQYWFRFSHLFDRGVGKLSGKL